MSELIYDFAVWLDDTRWSTLLHESYYMYNWVESTHVLALTLSLGMLFVIDLRMLGYAFADVPAKTVADRLAVPMAAGFALMFVTGALLFYAVPVRTAQSVWFRVKVALLVACAVNAFLFHRRMNRSAAGWSAAPKAPPGLRAGAAASLAAWSLIVVCGRFIAYDWFDCGRSPPAIIGFVAGCLDGQTRF